MPPPPRIPPPPTRGPAQRPAPEPRYEDVEEGVGDDPSTTPRAPRTGQYDFLPEEPRRRQAPPRRPAPGEEWDDDYGYDDEPLPPDDRRG